MAKHQQYTPRPTAPPSPMQQRQALPVPPAKVSEVPTLTAFGIGCDSQRRWVAALLTTQGQRVLTCAFLNRPSGDREIAEDTWRDFARAVLYRKEPAPALEQGTLVEGAAIAFHRGADSKMAALWLEIEDGRITPPDGSDWPGKVIYTGTFHDAWGEAEVYAARHLLTHTYADAKQRAADSLK